MPASARRRATPILPPARDRARFRALRSALAQGQASVDVNGTRVELPAAALDALTRAVEYLASGEPVLVLPADAEVTTGEAANILGFSRQYMVRLLDEGKLPHRREGSHRRLLLRDVIRYREKRIAEQHAALDELFQLSQEMGGYDMTAEDIASFRRDAGLHEPG
jgi:excisionase family DNA binding protein